MRDLYTTGVDWSPAEGIEVVSRFAVLIFSADTEDRYPVLRMMRHNALYGCTFCTMQSQRVRIARQNEHPPENEENRTVSKCYYPVGVGDIRSDAMMRQDMRQATATRTTVRGVKGISPLYPLEEFRFDRGPIV